MRRSIPRMTTEWIKSTVNRHSCAMNPRMQITWMLSEAPKMPAVKRRQPPAGRRLGGDRERLLLQRRGDRRIGPNITARRPGIDFDRRDTGGQSGSEQAGTP